MFTFTFAMASFKTAVLGFSEEFFTILMQKIAFSLEAHNHSKKSCFIMVFFPFLCPLKRRSGENGKFPNLTLVLLPDFLCLVSFFALDLIPKQQAKVLSGIVSHKVEEWNCRPEESSKSMEFIRSRYRLPTWGVAGTVGGPREGFHQISLG